MLLVCCKMPALARFYLTLCDTKFRIEVEISRHVASSH
jgi:hypothetical protein